MYKIVSEYGFERVRRFTTKKEANNEIKDMAQNGLSGKFTVVEA